MREPFVLWVCLVAVTTGLTAHANMRAPSVFQSRGMEEVRPVGANLQVLEEELRFDADRPYTSDRSAALHHVWVTARYTVRSPSAAVYVFTFISSAPADPVIHVNFNPVYLETITVDKDRKEHRWDSVDLTKWQMTFRGELKEGENIIEVRYSQPMSFHETQYGYLTKSKYRTSFRYHLYPLKEWQLDPKFALKIRIRFRDDSGLRKNLFGSKYAISVYGVDQSGYDEKGHLRGKDASTPIPLMVDRDVASDVLDAVAQFGSEFPDILEIVCE